jgi:hypothetical protein
VLRLLRAGWRVMWWIVFVGAVAVATVAVHLNRHIGNTIRARVEAQLSERFPGLRITVRSAELVSGEGLDVRGVSIVEPGAAGPRAELAHIEEVRLTCATDLGTLLSGEPEIRQITIRRPTIWATRRSDGSWSIARLLPKPDKHLPLLKFENGTIEIFDPLKTPSSTLTLRDINVALVPNTQPGAAGGCPRKFQGTLAGDHFRQITLAGLLDPATKAWTATGTVEGLQVSPDLCTSLPNPLAAQVGVLASIRGEAGCTFQVGYVPGATEPYRFSVTGRLSRARIDDPRLPRALNDVHAGFRCDNQGVSVQDFSARSGQTSLRLTYRRGGYAADGPWGLDAEIRHLELDSRLLAVLPDTYTRLWAKYLPTGSIDVDARLTCDGRTCRPEATVTCQNVSFTYHTFPYRLEYGRGTLSLKNDVLRLGLSAQSAGHEVRLTGEVTRPFDAPAGWMEIRGDDLPLDEKLLAALPEHHRAVVHSLHPQGTCSFQIKLWREHPGDLVHKQLAAILHRCAMRCDQFPYPVYDIRGRLDMLDDQWEFNALEGVNDTGRITGSGYLHTRTEGSELHLKLAGTSVPLEEELRDALRPNMRQLWADIRPHGEVNLVAEVTYLPGRNLSVSVLAEPQSETTWVEPVQFPYRLEKLSGTMSYRDGRFTIGRLRAEHGHVKLSATGYCDFLPDASWRFRIENLAVDQLVPDRELIQALPNRIRKSLGGLNSSGPVNLRGWLELEHGSQQSEPVRSRWDLVIGFQGGSIDCGISLQNLCGEMTLAGAFDGQRMYSCGELSIDSATYKDLQLTQILGPVWIDDEQVLLGSWVERGPTAATPEPPEVAAARQRARPLTAKLFGGTVWGDGWVVLGDAPRFGARAALADADLARCAQEFLAGQQNLAGHVFGTLEIRGVGRSIHNLTGRGNLRMRDGNVYELPLMVALLKILSIRQPDTTAFSQSDMDFRISGNHIYFDRANFAGDAISLEGTGEMNFDGQLQMTFHAIVGRGDPYVPVLQELVGGASQQIMLIHVDGTLQDPHTRREAFPGVNKALQQLANPDGLFPSPAR